MVGTITFRPIEANLTHNTDLLTKMNPYCSIILGTQKYTSQVCKKGGKHPVWNDSLSVPTGNESVAIVELLDKDRLTKDDIIGGCSINLKDLEAKGSSRNWYPLFYKNKPAGEILLETTFEGGLGMGSGLNTGLNTGMMSTQMTTGTMNTGTGILNQGGFVQENMYVEQPRGHVYTEQHQTVEPHTFMKNVEVVETIPVQKQIEVTEARRILKDVEYTQAVPVTKQIDVVEPVVVMREIEVIEPRVVTKTIEVVENVPVKKHVEVVEMQHRTQNVQTFEPQTFHKQVEVTEQVPMMKTVTVNEPVTVTKAVEFVQPIITTQTITKEIRPEVIVDQKITTEVGAATLVGVMEQTSYNTELLGYIRNSGYNTSQWAGWAGLNESQWLALNESDRFRHQERISRDRGFFGNFFSKFGSHNSHTTTTSSTIPQTPYHTQLLSHIHQSGHPHSQWASWAGMTEPNWMSLNELDRFRHQERISRDRGFFGNFFKETRQEGQFL